MLFARGCGCRGDIVLRCIAAVSLLAGEMFLRADVVALLILSVMRCSIVVVVHGGGASLCVAFVETDVVNNISKGRLLYSWMVIVKIVVSNNRER